MRAFSYTDRAAACPSGFPTSIATGTSSGSAPTGTTPAGAGLGSTLKPNYLCEYPQFHKYLQSRPLYTASGDVLGSYTTAGQFNVVNGQLPRADASVMKLCLSFTTTPAPASAGAFTFSGDALQWTIANITRQNNSAWLARPDGNGVPLAPDTPSGSFFCQKPETHLRLASFPRANYTLVDTLPVRQPTGTLACETLSRPGTADVFLEDWRFILRALSADSVMPDVDAPLGLSAAQRADARVWQAWTNELVYSAVVCTRWLRPANYTRSAAALPVPAPVRPFLAWFLHRRISTRLSASGVGMHSDAELNVILEEWVDALDPRLADGRQWFHGGNAPSSADVMLASLLMNCASEVANPEFNAMWMRSERVRAYAERCTRQWFPEYEGVLLLLRKTV
ncbi:hypothetical protein AURDEDRAFT_173520 [Auricularia subglabra TFB-10046 SS5]|nr:hypothetical protein AURDEDRAFT_173520 [Auricularia subglabra TFB-10046 SS5]